jgi:hypothetical protein
MTHRAAFVALVSALVLVPACSGRTAASGWIERAEAAHHDADRLLAQGDVAGARNALRTFAESDVPKNARAEDARIVRQDLYCRLATLESEHGEPREGVRWATTGLSLGRGEDVFTANLEIVRGRALEHLGDANGASRDYHDALVITETLLDLSLGGPRHDHPPNEGPGKNP